MLLDGKKVACATCIKGHRATHCKHKDRPMVEIKKIGRPSTQCERCRALRLVRQLHVKCNCSEERPLKRTLPVHDDGPKKKRVIANLRVIAPRQVDTSDGHQPQRQQQPVINLAPATIPTPPKPSCCSSSSNTQILPIECQKSNDNNKVASPGTPDSALSSSSSSCCGSQTSAATILPTSSSSCCGGAALSTHGVGSPTAATDMESSSSSPPPPSSTCCPSSTTTRNALGRPIRLVTCRCGDSCTCIGCDAHPARAMKSYSDHQEQDPYAGYSDLSLGRRGLSIAAICLPSTHPPPSPPSSSSSSSSSSSCSSSSSSSRNLTHSSLNTNDDRPTSVLAENGALLCGCGCSHALNQCTDCFQELCQDYFAHR